MTNSKHMLIKSNSRKNMATQQNSGALYNALTAGSKIIGTVVADNDMRIDGVIDGDVKCSGKLVIGEHGSVNGNVECQSADIMGKVEGKLDVKTSLALRASCTIIGDVSTGSLVVEPNAIFNGTCSMGAAAAEK
jgi:cytoskeletal protein CcmA (bactofilin family)